METLILIAVGILLAVAIRETWRWWIARRLCNDRFTRTCFIGQAQKHVRDNVADMSDEQLLAGLNDPHGFGFGIGQTLAHLDEDLRGEVAEMAWDELCLEGHRRGMAYLATEEADLPEEGA